MNILQYEIFRRSFFSLEESYCCEWVDAITVYSKSRGLRAHRCIFRHRIVCHFPYRFHLLILFVSVCHKVNSLFSDSLFQKPCLILAVFCLIVHI